MHVLREGLYLQLEDIPTAIEHVKRIMKFALIGNYNIDGYWKGVKNIVYMV